VKRDGQFAKKKKKVLKSVKRKSRGEEGRSPREIRTVWYGRGRSKNLCHVFAFDKASMPHFKKKMLEKESQEKCKLREFSAHR